MNMNTQGSEPRSMQVQEYKPFGSAEPIKLSVAIIQKMIAQPTKSGKLPTETECIKFLMLCKARLLNPFEGDCYFLGYDGKDGPQFSMITAHQVFLKRAEMNSNFDGMQSGVIIEVDGEIKEREGDFTSEGEKVVGGWARVFRKDRSMPTYRRVKRGVYDSGRSRWGVDPGGMCCKVAEADALRSSFPAHLGGLYSETESSVPVVSQVSVAEGPQAQAAIGEMLAKSPAPSPRKQAMPALRQAVAAPKAQEAIPTPEPEPEPPQATQEPAQTGPGPEQEPEYPQQEDTLPNVTQPLPVEAEDGMSEAAQQVKQILALCGENEITLESLHAYLKRMRIMSGLQTHVRELSGVKRQNLIKTFADVAENIRAGS
jgi:phage recombination protein Bet